MNTTKLIAVAAAIGLVACTNAKRQRESAAHATKTADRRVAEDKKTSGAEASDGKVRSLTASDFRSLVMDYESHPQEWVYEGKRPAVIDFYATWCGPCKTMSPVVEAMASAYAGKIDFYKVDIDKEQQLAATFGIQSIPTFLFVPVNGKPTLLTGAMPKEEFEKAVCEKLLNHDES